MKLIRPGEWFRLVGALAVILVGVALGASVQEGDQFSWAWLLSIVFWTFVLVVVWLIRPSWTGHTRWSLHWSGTILVVLGIVAVTVYALTFQTFAAWGTTIFIFALFLNLDEILVVSFTSSSLGSPLLIKRKGGVGFKPSLTRWLFHIILAVACGGLTVLTAQFESHFADEEFFVALQAFLLAFYWLALREIWGFLTLHLPRKSFTELLKNEKNDAKNTNQIGLDIDLRWLIPACLLIAIAFLIFTVRSYQRSFYPTEAPSYPGISANTPFLCGQVASEPQTYDNRDTFQRLIGLVEANPYKSTPEYGMLALGTGEARWSKIFHDSLLSEASQELFTGPAGSVKSVQFDAALRVYYYSQAKVAFPDLFTPAEEAIIRQWFFAINRRALTVEPVDWLYALAFSKWPAGPYENQENGAGLLALLEKTGLADPALSVRNQNYLDANQRGWMARFRVTDDAAVYQPEWIDNSYFQSLYTGDVLPGNVQNSFEWLLLQALPDGAPLKYNHIGSVSMDGIAYLGAELTGNNSYLWLAGRTEDYLESHGLYANAQPGVEKGTDLVGSSPTQGSCLLYGDSGLPNQIGPLAPDKIVFRDGWSPDSTYLLLNLRFSGWHRYKATNTITLVYQSGELSGDLSSGATFGWLPTGRSLYRDKRIPRENLNGLVIARTGMSEVVSTLSGIGGLWAQDVPYYASVENFATGPEMDTSTTELSGWRGWIHRRTIYFYHDGPIVVVDDAQGPKASPAAMIWHFPESAGIQNQRVQVRTGAHPAEVVLIPIVGTIHTENDDPGLQVQVQNPGHLSLVTVFLTSKWVGAKVSILGNRIVVNGPHQIEFSIP